MMRWSEGSRLHTVAIYLDEERLEGIKALTPSHRLGQPEDPAALARFLLSEESSWMTGTILNVDGGRTALA